MTASQVVNVSVSVSARGVTTSNFNVPLITCGRVPWTNADLFRLYTSTTAMAADGFDQHDAAYVLASMVFDQNPAPAQVMVGKRAPSTQVIELTPSAPAAGVIYDATIDGHDCTYTALGGDNLAAVCTAFAAAISAANPAGPTAILATGGASSAAPHTYATTELNGAIGTGTMSPPRVLELVLSNHTDWDATTAVVTGKDVAGNTITDNIAIPNNGNTTVFGTKRFASVTSILIPAQTGSGGTFTLGVRARVVADGSSGTKVVCTAQLSGVIVPYTGITATLSVHDATADPGIATDLSTIRTATAGWYGLLIDSTGAAENLATAAWAESREVLFVAQTADTACVDGSSTTDVAYLIKHSAYMRSSPWYSQSIGADWLSGGVMGEDFGRAAGSATWALKTIAGVAIGVLNETQQAALDGKNCNYYVEDSDGLFLTFNGVAGSGLWLDLVRGIDWQRALIRARVKTWITATPKRSYTDEEIAGLGGEILASLKAGVRQKVLAASPAPTVSLPAVADVSPTDRANRRLPNVGFAAQAAGAVQSVAIAGTVTQ